MTAPESSPKPAEAIALLADCRSVITRAQAMWADREWTFETASILKRIDEQEAAIQRGDGQTKPIEAADGGGTWVLIKNGDEPAAKPNETSGATPRTDAAIVYSRVRPFGEPKKAIMFEGKELVRADDMAQLERELNAVRAAGAEAPKQCCPNCSEAYS